jgi:succinyl-CoA synthetase beta subunit
VDKRKLAEFFSLFSLFVASRPEIVELDINPLIALPKEFLILDARIVLRD